MDGRCHGFVTIVLRVLLEKLHLEKKCGILNNISECPDNTESWRDSKNTRRRNGGGRGPCFYMMGSSCMVGGSQIVSYPVVCPRLCFLLKRTKRQLKKNRHEL